MEKKDRVIVLRLTENEFSELKRRASDVSMGYGAYVRKLIKKDLGQEKAREVLKKDAGQKRNMDIHFRATEAETKRIRDLSRISGLSATSILRGMIMKATPPKIMSIDDKKIIIQLKRIGNNINQIAAVANTTKTIDELYLRENLADLEDVLNRIRSVYGI